MERTELKYLKLEYDKLNGILHELLKYVKEFPIPLQVQVDFPLQQEELMKQYPLTPAFQL